MGDTAIRAEHLSKQYRIVGQQGSYSYHTLREAMIRALGAPLRWIRGADSRFEAFWALDDVSFEITHGEAVGIIGRNGAGKSTLLKIISRITRPTRGRVELYGRVGSLLEVGTGFHPELTGRENVYLNGAILGMSRGEIGRKFDEIVAFSEVEKFLDTSVKFYSSGMYVRLAFAVAAHLEPEILVVDEVLAVGDVDFQKKCLGKMGDIAHQGRTVLFVSHNMSAVQDLCKHAIWVDRGKIVQGGEAAAVVGAYLSRHADTRRERSWQDAKDAPGNETVRLLYAAVIANNRQASDELSVKTPLSLVFRIFNHRPDLEFHFNYLLYNKEGICVFNTASKRGRHPHGIVEARCEIPGDLLNNNIYSVKFFVHYVGIEGVQIDNLLTFEVHDAGRGDLNWYGEWIGAVRPNLVWEIDHLGE
jgi:lipopolysaccharide transport system ATP-binding protein